MKEVRLIDAEKLGLTDFEIVMCDGDYKEALKMVLGKIENAPTVDAEPIRHGHWVGDFCSVCGESALGDTDNFDIYGIIHSKYCPNCGAKMDEVEE